VVPSGPCGGAAAGDYDALHDSRGTWTPATTGFVLVSTQVPGCHGTTAAAELLIDFAADWAGPGPGTGLVVWSDHGTRGLDFLSGLGGFASTSGSADAFGSMDTGFGGWGGLSQSALEGWGPSTASVLASWPADFDVVLTDTGGAVLAVARDSCDWDVDGYLAQGGTCGGTDCDDRAFQVYPGAPEDCDGVDDDCNGVVDDSPSSGGTTFHADVDGDGYGDAATSVVECTTPAGYVSDATDCDDGDASVHPGALEVCDGAVDEDCDGWVDESDASDAGTWFADADGDGFGDPLLSERSCGVPSGFVADATDCDDTSALSFPGGTETCDGSLDEDCDGFVDEDDASDAAVWHRDFDGDGYGDPLVSRTACTAPSGFVADATDCNDALDSVHPGAAEVWYDGIDQDCAGQADENDADGDGHDAEGTGGLDCDDQDPSISPDASEVWYDGVDQDCDGGSDHDADGDGHDAEGAGGLDCDDGDPSVSPDAAEVWYDGVDQDCDGASDQDADGDGFDADVDDCDDADPGSHPAAPEVPDDGVDQDCDGQDEVTPEPVDTGADGSADDTSETSARDGEKHAGCATLPTRLVGLLPLVMLLPVFRRSRRPW